MEFGTGIVIPSLDIGKDGLNSMSFFGTLSRKEDFCIANSVLAVSVLI